MHPFLSELRAGLKTCKVDRLRLLVAVSGGADSVALLRGLADVSDEFSLNLCVAHLNHRIRGEESDSDASWVARLAATLNLPCELGEISPEEFSVATTGLEETARKLRYQFFEQAAGKFDCQTVALAHTADDQSETVLHHLFRGTGIAGLRGIPAVWSSSSGCRIVRPLLAVRRSLIEAYLQERGQSFCTDLTNADTFLTRNKIRHIVLPMLREQINPQIDAALLRLAEQASEIEEILHTEAERLLASSLKDQQPMICRIDISHLSQQPRHLVREMFRVLWRHQDWPQQSMGFVQWNRLADVLETRKPIVLPNQIEVRFHSENLLILRRG